MELENIVANTVYLKAREGGPEGSKGRRLVLDCSRILKKFHSIGWPVKHGRICSSTL